MKILITAKQRPYYGGSATNAYKLTKYLRQLGIKTSCLFFNNDNVDVDPDKIGGVFKVEHNSKIRKVRTCEFQLRNLIKIYLGALPHIILAFNTIITITEILFIITSQYSRSYF